MPIAKRSASRTWVQCTKKSAVLFLSWTLWAPWSSWKHRKIRSSSTSSCSRLDDFTERVFKTQTREVYQTHKLSLESGVKCTVWNLFLRLCEIDYSVEATQLLNRQREYMYNPPAHPRRLNGWTSNSSFEVVRLCRKCIVTSLFLARRGSLLES